MGLVDFSRPSVHTDTELQLCVEIYMHPRISQRDFPVMHFVQHKSTETKIKILAST